METFVVALTVFILATFLGFEVITKVPPLLHTPLVSGSNAISGITIVGSLICAGGGFEAAAAILSVCAVSFAMINVVGGYLVTHRMLKAFRKSRT